MFSVSPVGSMAICADAGNAPSMASNCACVLAENIGRPRTMSSVIVTSARSIVGGMLIYVLRLKCVLKPLTHVSAFVNAFTVVGVTVAVIVSSFTSRSNSWSGP